MTANILENLLKAHDVNHGHLWMPKVPVSPLFPEGRWCIDLDELHNGPCDASCDGAKCSYDYYNIPDIVWHLYRAWVIASGHVVPFPRVS